MRHDPTLIGMLSGQTGLSRRTVRRGLDDLIREGFLVHDERGYIAAFPKEEPPTDQAGGSVISLALAPLVGPDSQRGRDEK